MSRALGFFAGQGITVERVLTDNGSCYRSREFARTLADASVAHRRTRPYRPQTNGKVERFNLTLKWEWAYAQAYDSNDSRTAELERWLHTYNYHRPHMAHAGRPPISALTNVPGKDNWLPAESSATSCNPYFRARPPSWRRETDQHPQMGAGMAQRRERTPTLGGWD
jgi:hypothetical protein